MLSVPVLDGGICSRRRLLPISCAENFGKTSAQHNLGSRLRLLNDRGLMMLRVETQRLDGALICRLEGRFTGEGAEEVRRLATRCDSELELVVDLTDVMFIDAIGEQVLLFSRGWELSSLPRPRILGTFANGFSSRLLASVRRTCKCQLIRTETGIVLAADDHAHRTGHRALCRIIAPLELAFEAPIGRFSYTNQIWFASN